MKAPTVREYLDKHGVPDRLVIALNGDITRDGKKVARNTHKGGKR